MAAKLLYVAASAKFFCTHRLPLALEAARRGFEVHVAVPPDAELALIRDAGIAVHEWDVSRSGVSPAAEIRSVAALARLYRRIAPLLVHHVALKPILYGTIAARLAGVKCVVNAVTGLGYMFTSTTLRARVLRVAFATLGRMALRHPNGIFIFQNPDDARVFERLHLARAKDTRLVRGSGVDPARYVNAPEPEGPPRILFASRMLWGKGIREFVEAARAFRGSGARFILAGEPDPGNPESAQQSDLKRWQADGLIEWLGYRQDMPSVFTNSHIVVLPSRYGEGVPKALIEAAACGRPLVATDIPGCREILIDGHNGLLVPPGDVPALCRAITRLLENPSLRVEMGRRGRDLVQSHFSLRHVIEQTLGIYEDLASIVRKENLA